MTTYLRPGVFVEETLNPLASPSTDTSDAFAAFVGVSSKGGPLGPVLVTSWAQYQGLFGDLRGTSDDLGYAVYSFFNNGGAQCYVTRAVPADATAATLTLNDPIASGDTAVPALTITASSPGSWASDPNSGIFVTVQQRTNPDGTAINTGRFDLTIQLGLDTAKVASESFVDLSLDPADGRNALAIVNSDTVGSKYVTLSDPGTYGSADGQHGNPASVSLVALTGGTDGTSPVDLMGAVETLDVLDVILALNLPGISDVSTLTSVITWAQASGNRFVVVDTPKPAAGATAADAVTSAVSFAQSLPATSYVAVYGPWLYTQDPASSVSGAIRETAPGGAVLGQYSRNDVLNGVQKVPAGINTTIKAQAPMTRFTGAQLDSLNQAQVNVIRTVPGAGLCIMGGRTLDTSTVGRYINARRTLMYLSHTLTSLSRFAIFDGADSSTWETIDAVLSQFLTTFWQGGGLKGSTVSEAFFVTCDSTNNSAADIAAGTVNVDVGVALESPAEFIVIRIGQFDGTTTTTDSLTNGTN